MIGTQLGSYQILSELGVGGMGVVYTARHALMGKTAVVKLLRPEFSRSQEAVNRFFNEAKAASLIDHPGIVDIYDFGYAPDGSAYIVMELLPGESLKARRERAGRMAVGDAIRIIRQIADALTAAHAKAIIHRDLKPDNVFLVPDREVAGGERAKLLDFGIAKLADPSQSGPVHTQTGQMIGTPTYMSPEQCEGAGSVDQRTDIYSLGCILYELLCGRPPFMSPGVGGMIAAHLTSPVPPPRAIEPSVPMAVEALIMSLLAKRPDDRPQTMEHVYQQLGALATQTAIVPAGVGVESTLVGYGGGVASATGAGAVAPIQTTAGTPPSATTLGTASGQSRELGATRGGSGRKIGIAIAVVALLAGGALAVVMAVKDKGAVASIDAGAVAVTPTIDAAPVAVKIDAAAVVAVTPDAAVVAVAIDAAPVAVAVDAGRAVVVIDAGATPGTPDDDKHDREYARFHDAIKSGDLDKVSFTFAAIDRSSPHFAKAKAERDKAFDRFQSSMLSEARMLAANQQCDKLATLKKIAAAQSGEAGKAVAKIECKEAEPVDPPPGNGADPDKLHDRAKALIADGRHGQAIRLLRQAVKLSPRNGSFLLSMCRAQKGAGSLPAAARSCRRAIRLSSSPRERQEAERLIREMQLE